ncbi:Hypothetical predicted protein [Octopus vulgaris]|uniref:Uncharacterized protein n=1 Tax=Octopus vulgaris TaxID=6645 RepID=A0AA36BK61_OCTVU|nr:Hypothetical predicted protein [Octopus vulgaris]
MSDELVEYMEDSFGVRMDMDGLRIGNEHSGDSENKRTGVSSVGTFCIGEGMRICPSRFKDPRVLCELSLRHLSRW